MEYNEITYEIIGAAIEVHNILGPGLFESAYEECLAHEMTLKGLKFEKQKSLPVCYKGIQMPVGYRLDLIVEKKSGCRNKECRKDVRCFLYTIINVS